LEETSAELEGDYAEHRRVCQKGEENSDVDIGEHVRHVSDTNGYKYNFSSPFKPNTNVNYLRA
jgi:hypothetical protein